MGGPLPRRAGRRHRSTVAVLVAALLSACTASSSPGSEPLGLATVQRVVDGDTIVVIVGATTERVRLIGVDTPESVHPSQPVECFGPEASTHLAGLLPVGTSVLLARDVVARDRYDRLLAYVYRAEDDLLVNLALVEGGFGEAVTYGDNEALYDTLVAAEADARADDRGMWGACDLDGL